MNHILQNVKSGFANMRELVGIFLSVNENSDGYDVYINGNDVELSKIAKVLKDSEEKQESQTYSFFADSHQRKSRKNTKKNFKSSTSTKNNSLHQEVSNNEHIRRGIEPEI